MDTVHINWRDFSNLQNITDYKYYLLASLAVRAKYAQYYLIAKQSNHRYSFTEIACESAVV